jgi:hypothetical protein
LNGWQSSLVSLPAGASITGGQSFIVNSTVQGYYIWYTVNGSGTDPHSATTGLQVSILSTDSATVVAQKTQLVINSYSYMIQNMAGLFVRSQDTVGLTDKEFQARFSLMPNPMGGDNIGSLQFSANEFHDHSFITLQAVFHGITNGGVSVGIIQGGLGAVTGFAGNFESRPTNIYAVP